MRPAVIVVRNPRGNDELEMTLIERNQKIQTLAAQAPAKALAHRIRFRRPHRRSQDSHTHSAYLSMANYQIGPVAVVFFEVLIGVDTMAEMRDFVILFIHMIVTLARLARLGGLRSVVAESVLVRHQLLILNRGRKRSPNLRASDRIIAGLCTLFMRSARVLRSAIVLKPSTLLHLQSMLLKRKYRILFSPGQRCRPGPKGPNKDLIDVFVAMKQRNPSWGCPRISQQISLAFGVEIDKDGRQVAPRGIAAVSILRLDAR